VIGDTAPVLQALVLKRAETALRGLGFVGSKGTYRLRTSSYGFLAKVTKSVHNRRDRTRFTIDLFAREPTTGTGGIWWKRLGTLLPMGSDHWWELTTGADPEPVSEQVEQTITEFASLAMSTLLEVPGLPGSSLPRLWKRPLAGIDDEARNRLPRSDQLMEQRVAGYLVQGWTTAELIDRLARDPLVRPTVIFEMMLRNLQADQVAVALADRLDHDSSPVVRGRAARAYGSLGLGVDVPERLQLVVDEDENLDVRWNARYSIALRERYGPGWLKTIENQWWRPNKRPSIYDGGPGVIVSPLPPAILAQLPAEAARRGMSVEELTVRVHLGLPMDDPLVAFWRSTEADEPAPGGI